MRIHATPATMPLYCVLYAFIYQILQSKQKRFKAPLRLRYDVQRNADIKKVQTQPHPLYRPKVTPRAQHSLYS